MHDGHTIAVPHCAACPLLQEWPIRSLIMGTCPRCGQHDGKAWRMLIAFKVMASRTGGKS